MKQYGFENDPGFFRQQMDKQPLWFVNGSFNSYLTADVTQEQEK
jgi:hypothetical protein